MQNQLFAVDFNGLKYKNPEFCDKSILLLTYAEGMCKILLNEIEAHYVKSKPPQQPRKVGRLKGAGAEVGLRCAGDWAGYSDNIRLTVADHCGVLSLNVVSFRALACFYE